MAKLTPEGCRAGRALLRWTVRDLGAQAGISGESISAYENGRPIRHRNAAKVLAVFDQHGVEVLDDGAPGARLRRSS
jgi:transcriptional regulator with XRE-family HTH domain